MLMSCRIWPPQDLLLAPIHDLRAPRCSTTTSPENPVERAILKLDAPVRS